MLRQIIASLHLLSPFVPSFLVILKEFILLYIEHIDKMFLTTTSIILSLALAADALPSATTPTGAWRDWRTVSSGLTAAPGVPDLTDPGDLSWIKEWTSVGRQLLFWLRVSGPSTS